MPTGKLKWEKGTVLPMRAAWWSSLLCLLLAAGCAEPSAPAAPGPADAGPDPSPAVPDKPTLVEAVVAEDGRLQRATFHGEGHVGAEAVTYLAGPMDTEGWQLEFPVAAGATAVVVEVAWNDTVQDLDAVLGGANGCFDHVPFPEFVAECMVDLVRGDGTYGYWWNKEGSVGMPDSPSRIVATGPQLQDAGEGTWTAYIWSKDVNVELGFHIFATVLYDGTDPAAVSVIPWT